MYWEMEADEYNSNFKTVLHWTLDKNIEHFLREKNNDMIELKSYMNYH
jgi:hypothetical protein